MITDASVMTFGKHKGRKMGDVPDDYLRWWLGQTNVEALKIDSEFASFPAKAIAAKKLKLWVYIRQRLNGSTEVQSH